MNSIKRSVAARRREVQGSIKKVVDKVALKSHGCGIRAVLEPTSIPKEL